MELISLKEVLYIMASISNIVGTNIERERVSRALTQADLAKALKVKPLTVYRWETGRVWPTAKNIEALARLFKVNATTLFARPSTPYDPKIKEALLVISRALGISLKHPRRRSSG